MCGYNGVCVSQYVKKHSIVSWGTCIIAIVKELSGSGMQCCQLVVMTLVAVLPPAGGNICHKTCGLFKWSQVISDKYTIRYYHSQPYCWNEKLFFFKKIFWIFQSILLSISKQNGCLDYKAGKSKYLVSRLHQVPALICCTVQNSCRDHLVNNYTGWSWLTEKFHSI